MTKRQLIDQIVQINHTAHPGFLATFGDEDLKDYFDHLRLTRQPRLLSDPGRYEKYFEPAVATATETHQSESSWRRSSDSRPDSPVDLYADDLSHSYEPVSEDGLAGDPADVFEDALELKDESLAVTSTIEKAPLAEADEDTEAWLF